MSSDFFDLLYNGYTGEYQMMSSLYRNGLDVLRPSADMGIDVVSLNLKQQLEHPGWWLGQSRQRWGRPLQRVRLSRLRPSRRWGDRLRGVAFEEDAPSA